MGVWRLGVARMAAAWALFLACGGGRAANVDLADDVVAIGKANAKAIARLRSGVATLEVWQWSDATMAYPPEHAKLLSTSSELAYTTVLSVWFDGRKVRQDARLRLSVGELRPEVRLRVGSGEVLLAPPDERREIASVEAYVVFVPSTERVVVSPGDKDLPYGRRQSVLHQYACALDWPLQDTIALGAASGVQPSLTETTLNGATCRLLQWEVPSDRDVLRVWVVPAMGHMVAKVERISQDRPRALWTARLKDYGNGVFWFEEVESKEWMQGRLSAHKTVKVTSFAPNLPVDGVLFTLDGMGIPPGTTVDDLVLQTKYRYGKPFQVDDAYVLKALSPSSVSQGGPPIAAAQSPVPMSSNPAGASPRPSESSAEAAPPSSASPRVWLVTVVGVVGALAAAAAVVLWRRRRPAAGEHR